MSLPQHLREQSDACRPGSDDLALAELADLAAAVRTDGEARSAFERRQSNDVALGDVVRDVPVPAGLAARIQAALDAAETQAADAVEQTPAEPVTTRSTPAVPWPAWLVLVAAVVLIGAYLVQSATTPALQGDSLATAALDWRNHEQLLTGQWRHDAQNLQANFPVTPFLRRDLVPRAWQACGTGQFGLSGVVYDVAAPGERKTYLFVFHAKDGVPGLANAPQAWPLRSTGGWSVGAWNEGSVVYVLLAEGEADRFRTLIRGGAIAA